MINDFSVEFIDKICRMYGDVYDDREEDSRIGGTDWRPGQRSCHLSLKAFQKELKDEYGITLSTGKIQKILISGGCWSTERSREIMELYSMYTDRVSKGGEGRPHKEACERIAEEMDISISTVVINLPYQKVVYDMEQRTENAERCKKYRMRK